ncbi:hypothetical protein ACQP1V_27315 [Microtetraspora malaysiensis]|uniref:hypothetical protein n=1 Tax=Microtetraspora malaysiensis TaxID=161358 RepID=UPI003D8C79C6
MDSAKGIVGGIRRVVIVLSLVVLIPLILLMVVMAVALFLKGDVLGGVVSSAVVVFMVWYCARPLLGTWEWDTLFGEHDDG